MKLLMAALIVGLLALSCNAAPVLIEDVPAYLWRQGCAPTAAAMVLSYWDQHGYPNLVPDDMTPESLIDELADLMGTAYGATSQPALLGGLERYAESRGYPDASARAKGVVFGYKPTLETYVSEIRQGRPVLLNIDLNGDLAMDHTVVGAGFDLAKNEYLSYTGYSLEPYGATWQRMGYVNGVGVAVYFDPGPLVVSEPCTFILVSLGLVYLGVRRRIRLG